MTLMAMLVVIWVVCYRFLGGGGGGGGGWDWVNKRWNDQIVGLGSG